MNWKQLSATLSLLCIPVILFGQTIKKYTDVPQVTTATDGMVVSLQTNTTQYGYITLANLRTYMQETALNITSLRANPTNAEIGSTVASTILTWTISGSSPTYQAFNQSIGSIGAVLRSYTNVASYSANRTYTLTATNITDSDTASVTVSFLNKVYWGPQAASSLNDAQIIALSSALASTFDQTRTITCAAEYMYFAWPTSYGTPQFTVNGLLNTAWTKVTRAFVNASGYSNGYDIYRSDNLLTGTYIVVVD